MPFRAPRRTGVNKLYRLLELMNKSNPMKKSVSRRAIPTHGLCVTPYILRRP